MPLRYFIADAFADELFTGNPAGVCLPDNWPEESLMQRIASENNLPETAFAIRRHDGEFDLCGHASLVPFWAERLGKDQLLARQLSPRGGTLLCENTANKVILTGGVQLYLEGYLRCL